MAWPATPSIVTERLRLEPLTVEHAASMLEVLADPAIYEYIGGEAPTLPELTQRYRAQSVGHSPDGSQWWLNWIVTLRGGAAAIGVVQATVERTPAGPEASLAWVIAPRSQGGGFATEATGAMVDWLGRRGVVRLAATIHPAHLASQAVAQKLGLHATSDVEDGEVCWCSADGGQAPPQGFWRRRAPGSTVRCGYDITGVDGV